MIQIEHTTLSCALHDFLRAKSTEGKSPFTMRLYEFNNNRMLAYLAGQGIDDLDGITPDALRGFFLELRDTNHNQGGIHGYFRCVRAFLKWVWDEYEIDRRNPIDRVKIKSPPVKARPGVSVEAVKQLASSCDTNLGLRDRCILKALLATGARAGEFTRLNIADVDFSTPMANVHIWKTKDDEPRVVHFGIKTKREVMRYLRERRRDGLRDDKNAPLFMTDEQGRFTVNGLRQVIMRRAADAGLPSPGLHDFRRGCGTMLRKNGMTLEYIRRYLGHSSLEITRRYLGEEDPEVEKEYQLTNPVDNINW